MLSKGLKPRRYGWKAVFGLLGGTFLLYVTTMMVVRLEMTSLAYDFDDVKNNERALREEQLRLQAMISRKLSDSQQRKIWREQGYEEPSPTQVVIIP